MAFHTLAMLAGALLLLACARPTSAIMYWSEVKNTSADSCTGRHCVVPAGEVLIMDSSLDVESLTVHGVLKWDTTVPDLEIRTGYILVSEGGYFKIGSRTQPMMLNATIFIKDAVTEAHKHDVVGYRFVATLGQDSRIDIHGRPLERTWTLLSRTAWPSSYQIFIKHDPVAMGWLPGDRIGIATTSRGNSTTNRIKSIGLASEWQLPLRRVGSVNAAVGSPALSAAEAAGDSMRWGRFCRHLCLLSDQYLTVELQSASNVTKVRILWDEVLYAPKYRVEVRAVGDDADQWQEATVVANAAPGWQDVPLDHLPGAISAVRLLVQPSGLISRLSGRNADLGVHVQEVEVYGSELDGPQPNVLVLEEPIGFKHWGGLRSLNGQSFEMAAEVVNLERSVVITGENTGEDAEDGEGIHTGMFGRGALDIRYTRLEHCGQRKMQGRYCMHFHDGGHCVECGFHGNAIVDGHQVGIAIDQTHRTVVESNIIWDAAGAGIYIRSGNEMYNMVSNNVAVCSSPGKCTVDWLHGEDNAGVYVIGMTNDLIGNRVVGYDNGIWAAGSRAPWGAGAMQDKVCPMHTPFGTVRGNVNHDCRVYGMRLERQFPRNLVRDANGVLTDPGSCSEFTEDGKDNGLVPPSVIEDGMDWHNMYVGTLGLGDVSIRRHVSVNNKYTLLWKESKNFADTKSWHIEGSVFANDPTDPFGRLQVLGPGGPIAFTIANSSFVGGPTDFGALTAGYQCGRVNASGLCASQYHLHGVNFSGLQKTCKRVKFGAFGTASSEQLPMFLTDDGSLGGHRSLVSRHMQGFLSDPGCRSLSFRYDDAIGCTGNIRRLRVKTKKDLGNVTLIGPGYVLDPNASSENGIARGLLRFEDNMNTTVRGYSAPVFAGRDYHVHGAWRGDVVFEFSDAVLTNLYGVSEAINISYAGQTCNLVSQPLHKETMFGVEICELRDSGVPTEEMADM